MCLFTLCSSTWFQYTDPSCVIEHWGIFVLEDSSSWVGAALSLRWAQVPLLRHLQTLKRPVKTSQDSGQRTWWAPIPWPLCRACLSLSVCSTLSREAGDHETTFHRHSQQGPRATASVTGLSDGLLLFLKLTKKPKTYFWEGKKGNNSHTGTRGCSFHGFPKATSWLHPGLTAVMVRK